GACDPREVGDARDADGDTDALRPGADHGGDRDAQENRWEGEQDIKDARHNRVHRAANIARDDAERRPDYRPGDDGEQSDTDGNPRAIEDPAEDVPAKFIGAEGMVQRDGA